MEIPEKKNNKKTKRNKKQTNKKKKQKKKKKITKELYDPQREKMYLLTYAHNVDSTQPAHPRRLIRVFVVRMKTLGHPKSPSEDSDQTARKRRLI